MSLPEHLDRAKAEYCRSQAAEALEQAAKMKAPDLRATWEFIARSYHGMADRLEQTSNHKQRHYLLGKHRSALNFDSKPRRKA